MGYKVVSGEGVGGGGGGGSSPAAFCSNKNWKEKKREPAIKEKSAACLGISKLETLH